MRGDKSSRNPRIPGSLSFEQLEFVNITPGDPKAEDLVRLAYLVSPERTGLLDEMMALVETGLLERTMDGGAVLPKDWFMKVDPLILENMEAHWSVEADPNSKYLVHPKVRNGMTNWERVDGGWALKEEPSDVIFYDEEWEEWRKTFLDREERRVNQEDGIGNFGI